MSRRGVLGYVDLVFPMKGPIFRHFKAFFSIFVDLQPSFHKLNYLTFRWQSNSSTNSMRKVAGRCVELACELLGQTWVFGWTCDLRFLLGQFSFRSLHSVSFSRFSIKQVDLKDMIRLKSLLVSHGTFEVPSESPGLEDHSETRTVMLAQLEQEKSYWFRWKPRIVDAKEIKLGECCNYYKNKITIQNIL